LREPCTRASSSLDGNQVKTTKQRQVKCVISALLNYTCIRLANDLDEIYYDTINDDLRYDK